MRGIPMTEPSVLGLLSGSKTQSRRLAKDRTKPLYKVGETLYVKEPWHYFGGKEYFYQQERGALSYRFGSFTGSDWESPLFMPAWASRLHITITAVRRQNLLDITEDDAHAEGIDEYHGLLDDADICAMAKVIGGMATDARTWYLTAWEDMHKRDRAKVRLEVGDPRYTTDKPWTTVRDYASLVAANPLVDAYTFTVTKL